ncbi:MAG: hypothetical protein ABSA58_26220 [Acetobacteraceae bacterium]|jgi:hypothetical protein
MNNHPRRAPWSAASRLALAGLIAVACHGAAGAASLTQKDVQILAKAIGFLEPPPSGNGTVAIAYDPADPASKQDADAIASYFGEGLKAGNAVLKPVVTAVGQLSSGGFVAVVAAAGVKVDQVATATRALHVACITADATAVQSGQCVMSVKSDPKVEILISRSAAASSNVGFGSAFLLMAHEI